MQSLSQICEPTLNALVYGVTGLSDETIKQLFIIIQEYITRTKLLNCNYKKTITYTCNINTILKS